MEALSEICSNSTLKLFLDERSSHPCDFRIAIPDRIIFEMIEKLTNHHSVVGLMRKLERGDTVRVTDMGYHMPWPLLVHPRK